MAPTGYPPAPTWQQNPYPQQTPTDLYYPQQQHQQQQPLFHEFRQLLTRLTEKVDTLNEKVRANAKRGRQSRRLSIQVDEKSNKNHPNMETSILLTNIQRIVKVFALKHPLPMIDLRSSPPRKMKR